MEGDNKLSYSVLLRDEDPTFFSMDPDPAQMEKKNPDPTFNRNEEKNIF